MFSDDALSLIHQVSRGLPRAVNNLAVPALVAPTPPTRRSSMSPAPARPSSKSRQSEDQTDNVHSTPRREPTPAGRSQPATSSPRMTPTSSPRSPGNSRARHERRHLARRPHRPAGASAWRGPHRRIRRSLVDTHPCGEARMVVPTERVRVEFATARPWRWAAGRAHPVFTAGRPAAPTAPWPLVPANRRRRPRSMAVAAIPYAEVTRVR